MYMPNKTASYFEFLYAQCLPWFLPLSISSLTCSDHESQKILASSTRCLKITSSLQNLWGSCTFTYRCFMLLYVHILILCPFFRHQKPKLTSRLHLRPIVLLLYDFYLQLHRKVGFLSFRYSFLSQAFWRFFWVRHWYGMQNWEAVQLFWR